MDLAKMLRVDRCRDMSPIRIIVQMPEPDCFFRYHISAGTRNFTSGKSDVYALAAAATHGLTTVLLTEPVSRRDTFVGGIWAPPSALLVVNYIGLTSRQFFKKFKTHLFSDIVHIIREVLQ